MAARDYWGSVPLNPQPKPAGHGSPFFLRNLRQDGPIKRNVGIMLTLALGPVFCMAADIPPCPAPEPPGDYSARKAPEEIYSVDRSAADGDVEYAIFIDLKYGGLSLGAVVLAYVSNDEILLMTNVDPLHLETQAVVNVVVSPSISEDVRIFWSYTESGKMCPDIVSLEYRFSETRAN